MCIQADEREKAKFYSERNTFFKNGGGEDRQSLQVFKALHSFAIFFDCVEIH